MVSADDGPRPGVTLEAVSQLKPVFRPDGRVTAGNCCPLNDGAAAVVIMSDTKARELGITPLARIVSTGVTALSPEIMGLGPVEASKQALKRAGMTIDDVDLVEINEAFAAQVIPSYRDLGIPIEKLNVNGGAIAVGHPFGMTGARITGTLLNSLDWHDKTHRPGDDVRRRRPGHGHGRRAALLKPPAATTRSAQRRAAYRVGLGRRPIVSGVLVGAGGQQVVSHHPQLVGQGQVVEARYRPVRTALGVGAQVGEALDQRVHQVALVGLAHRRSGDRRRGGPAALLPVADLVEQAADRRRDSPCAGNLPVRTEQRPVRGETGRALRGD